MLAYEPEAAALFAQYDFLHSEECSTQFCYLVADCGGGTVDIAAHRVTKQHGNILIDYIAPPHGGNCGGFAVNDELEKLMMDTFKIPAEKFKQLKVSCAAKWHTLMNQQFEEFKTMLKPNDQLSITLELPLIICKEINKITGKSLKELIDDFGDENIEWDDDNSAIILKCPTIDKLFKPVLDDICTLIKTVLAKKECSEIKIILLAGGFAESPYLFQRIESTFGKDYKINSSSDPTYSVVKGAVLCGQQEALIKPLLENACNLLTKLEPNFSQPQTTDSTDTSPSVSDTPVHTGSISQSPTMSSQDGEISMQIVKHLPPAITKHLPIVLSRKMTYTIGVEVAEEFQNGYHDINKLEVIDGEQFCDGIFFTLVKANESVYAGRPQRVYRFDPTSEKGTECTVNIFTSDQENVKYVDGCQLQRKITISIPEKDTKLSREINLCVNFYSTEAEIVAYSVTNNEVKETIPVSYEFSPTHL